MEAVANIEWALAPEGTTGERWLMHAEAMTKHAHEQLAIS